MDSCVAGTPVPETCDGIDNNCDGTVDDGIAAVATTCGVGACSSSGSRTCQGGQLVDSCVAGTPVPETCDGIDNNCDGSIDDGIAAVATTCGVGACASSGSRTCQGGQLVDSCVAGTPAPEICNGVDDDCNGEVDESDPGGGQSCSTGLPGVCSEGTTTCQSGSLICVANTQASAEICDGLDNNCDGVVDEGCPGE
ncbi:MAG: hypothetical protein HY049_15975 [Acidobacteria bacterium]|nr:hypothetical protein [Acidobacteriota bacterium]